MPILSSVGVYVPHSRTFEPSPNGSFPALDGAVRADRRLAPRPARYVFGAIHHAAALARVGKLLGYRVTVCDARAALMTPERFSEADALVVEWPTAFS